MTDRFKTVLTWGREVSKIAKKVLITDKRTDAPWDIFMT